MTFLHFGSFSLNFFFHFFFPLQLRYLTMMSSLCQTTRLKVVVPCDSSLEFVFVSSSLLLYWAWSPLLVSVLGSCLCLFNLQSWGNCICLVETAEFLCDLNRLGKSKLGKDPAYLVNILGGEAGANHECSGVYFQLFSGSTRKVGILMETVSG